MIIKIKQQPQNNKWILTGATEALKENILKYPTYIDLQKEHDKYWKINK